MSPWAESKQSAAGNMILLGASKSEDSEKSPQLTNRFSLSFFSDDIKSLRLLATCIDDVETANLHSLCGTHMAATQCFYEVLGVNQDATVAEIKKSYHTQALRYHPDKSGGDEEATEMFRRVQEAYEVLSNPLERRYYDDNRDELLNSDEE